MNPKWKVVRTPRMKLNSFLDALENRPPCPAKCEDGFTIIEEPKSYGTLRTRRVCSVCNGQGRVGEVKFAAENLNPRMDLKG